MPPSAARKTSTGSPPESSVVPRYSIAASSLHRILTTSGHRGCALVASIASQPPSGLLSPPHQGDAHRSAGARQRSCSAEKPQILRGEPTHVREHGREVSWRHTKPASERRRVLVGGSGGDPSALGGEVVRPPEREGGEDAVGLSTPHCAAEYQLVVAPGVVRASAGCRGQ